MRAHDSRGRQPRWVSSPGLRASRYPRNHRRPGCSGGVRNQRDSDVLRLFLAEAQAIPAQAEFDRITERRPADKFDAGGVAEAHFEQSSAEFAVAGDVDDARLAALLKTVERAKRAPRTGCAAGIEFSPHGTESKADPVPGPDMAFAVPGGYNLDKEIQIWESAVRRLLTREKFRPGSGLRRPRGAFPGRHGL